jgi:hypothetical protein
MLWDNMVTYALTIVSLPPYNTLARFTAKPLQLSSLAVPVFLCLHAQRGTAYIVYRLKLMLKDGNLATHLRSLRLELQDNPEQWSNNNLVETNSQTQTKRNPLGSSISLTGKCYIKDSRPTGSTD